MPNRIFPELASSGRKLQDEAQIWIHIVMLVVLVLMTFAIVYFAWKYRKREGNDKATSNTNNSHLLEWVWTVIPTVIFFYMFYIGVEAFAITRADKDVKYEEIDVLAQKWSWTFSYPGTSIQTSNVLYLEAGKRYRMNLSAPKTDVLHSFYMRSAGVKADIVPGRTNYVTFDTDLANFTASERSIGVKKADIFCTEYCGTNHSAMLARVNIMMPDVYKAWKEGEIKKAEMLKTAGPAERGEALFTAKGCNACHKVDGKTKGIGPNLGKVFGKEETLTGGAKVAVDENYVRESILEPAKKIVNGFAPSMPPFKGQLNDQELNDLVAYIKSLK